MNPSPEPEILPEGTVVHVGPSMLGQIIAILRLPYMPLLYEVRLYEPANRRGATIRFRADQPILRPANLLYQLAGAVGDEEC